MKSMNISGNDDAVSFSLGFIIMFSVSVIVFCALILSFNSILQSAEKSAIEETFKITGSGLAIKMTTIDIILNTTSVYGGTVNSLEYDFSLPASIANKNYELNVSGNPFEIIMTSDNEAKTVSPYNLSTNVTSITIFSGTENYRFKYNRSISSIYVDED